MQELPSKIYASKVMSQNDPQCPVSTGQLDDLLSEPDERVVQTMRQISGDVILLGVGGKMGPTLARMVKRASDRAGITRQVIGVSRFSSRNLQKRLESWGVRTIACDLLDENAIESLPDAENVLSMLGYKFGTTDQPSLTWAINCYLPAVISRRYRESRIAAFSSGNVYGTVDVAAGGSLETDPPRPVGEYAVSVLGRERIYDYFSRALQIPISLLRLNYATELRYGVLVDLARKVFEGVPVDLRMGYVNVIWQRDANAMAINSLAHAASPPRILNIAGRELLRVGDVCNQFASIMKRPANFCGQEAGDALLSDARVSYPLLGEPSKSAAEMIRWTAQWVMQGGESLGKPTHFENRDGSF